MALQTYTFTEVDISYVPSAVLSMSCVSIDVEIDTELFLPTVTIGGGDAFAPPLTGIVYPIFR